MDDVSTGGRLPARLKAVDADIFKQAITQGGCRGHRYDASERVAP